MPEVSVLLPVYNGAKFLPPAIHSILNQTHRDFELIIINDGSSDDSAQVIRNFSDSRIRFISQENQGLPATLNRGIREARGEIIFRQDQDDISHPERISRQIQYFNNNPDGVLLGTWARILNADGRNSGRTHKHPESDKAIRAFMCRDNPFVHSSTAFRKGAALAAGCYATDKNRQPPEDYEFWSRLIRQGKAANIPEFLLDYREVPTSMSRTGVNPFLEKVILISAENLAYASGSGMSTEACMNFTRRLHGLQTQVIDVAGFRKLLFAIRKNIGATVFSEAGRILLRIYLAYTDAVERTNPFVKFVRRARQILRQFK